MASEAHGGLNLAEMRRLGVDPGHVVDFSTNVNPLGPSPRVAGALAELDVVNYPDPTSLKLREKLAELNETSSQELLVGNGTAELIWLICRTILSPESKVIIAGPTFGEYRRAAEACGAEVVEIRADAPAFQPDGAAWQAAVEEHEPDLFFLCNPNNPTGWQLGDDQIASLAESIPGGRLVLDEAYRGFTELGPFGRRQQQAMITLRSMTKDFGMPGLRLGYLLAEPRLVERLRRQQPPWSVSGAAQAAGLAALADLAHLDQSLAQISVWTADLKTELEELGAELAPTNMHYFLVRVGEAFRVRRRFLREGCLVRDATSFGLPDWIRIGTRNPEENSLLLAAWQRVGPGKIDQPSVNEAVHVD